MRSYVIAAVLSISGWLAGAACAEEAQSVSLWGLFETVVENTRPYANPFRDVTLDATFTSPTGRTMKFLGFYDGDGKGAQNGNVWKLRFMPDEAGRWKWECAFSDGTPGTKGEFVCTEKGARPGPLRVEGRHFRFADGSRFYPRSYYLSEAFSAEAPQWKDAVETFFGGRYRYNVCCTTFWQGPLLAKNRWNALPFNGFYPTDGAHYDRLNLSAWRHVDEVLDALERRNVVWFNFDGFVPNVGGTMSRQGRLDFEVQKAYVRNAVARLAPRWNVLWNIAFEWNEFLSPEQVRRLADYVRSIDPWKHPVTVHDQGKLGTTDEIRSRLGVDFVTLQYDAGKCGDALKAAQFVGKYVGKVPVYAQEVCWEGLDKLNGDEVRRGCWGVALGGGIVNYAEQFDRTYGDGKGLPFVEILHDFMQGLPVEEMEPRPELVGAGMLCMARPGARYVCYAPAGGRIELDLSTATGAFTVEWLDPRTGKTRATGPVQGGAKRSFDCPDAGDWVLHVAAGSRR